MQALYETDEHTLLLKLRAGDEAAFRTVFDAHYRRLCVYAERFVFHQEEAADVVGEAFLQFWNGSKDFERMEHVKASLYLAVKRIGLNYQYSVVKSMERNYRYNEEQGEAESDHLLAITKVEALNELHAAIDTLPDRAKRIILDTYIHGKSNQEVADAMGISLQTVKNQKLRALSLLRGRIRRETFLMLITFFFTNV